MKARTSASWTPPLILLVGAVLLFAVGKQQRPALRAPLTSALPSEVRGLEGRDATISEQEAIVAGFSDYALRIYGDPEQVGSEADGNDATWASIYLGFYTTQTDGRTIHSPKNCLPGAGWEAISSSTTDITVSGSSQAVTVNRYLLQNGSSRALVLYWYQGRGRVAHNEYLVKWDLLRDAATIRRTDEALVRIVVPVLSSEEAAFELATEIAGDLVRGVDRALPAR